jgi:hypothetical protein
MSIRIKLYAAMAVAVAGLALTAGVGIWALTHVSDRFHGVRAAADARALALQLKFDVTDFNGWQTAYGYDNGKSRPVFLASVARFRTTLARARSTLRRPEERELIDRIGAASDDFMRLDDRAWAALQAGRADEVKRLFLGPELEYFGQAAAAAEALAKVEQRRESQEERRFEDARHDALRLLILSAIVASLLVGILLVTANDLAREADRRLHSGRDEEERTDGGAGG